MKVLITGGNGFLGRGILRRAQREGWDWDITTMSRDEAKMLRVAGRYPNVRTIKGDVSDDVDYLARLLDGQEVVIHAGANKLVDVGERSAFEVYRNNIVGSEHLARAAIKAGVRRVIGISSDKAVQPVNIYGMSKAVMERLFQEADGIGDTQFVLARYGNVVGSTMSIVLFFEEQLERHGYMSVTNPAMSRFYMGVDQAIDIILYALNRAQRGSVAIAKMAAMTVADVARLVLGLPRECDPLELLGDKRIRIVGARPGEKLHESLLHEQESVRVCALAPGPGDYWELRPSPEPLCNPTPFSITSADPPLGWMPFDRMRELIEDAKTV